MYEYSPLEIKKAIVGYGRAEKAQVQSMAKAILKREWRIRSLKGFDCIWLYRSSWPIGPAWAEKWLARRGFRFWSGKEKWMHRLVKIAELDIASSEKE